SGGFEALARFGSAPGFFFSVPFLALDSRDSTRERVCHQWHIREASNDSMTPLELEALKRAYGLNHITDLDELRAAIEERCNAMNRFERAATLMKVGGYIEEAKVMSPGARYSPPTWSLVLVCALA